MRWLGLLAGLLCVTSAAAAETITVSAAASLTDAMSGMCKAFEEKTGNHVELNLAASGPLQSQIEHGAPVDAFISAADEPIDRLTAEGLVQPDSRRLIARNQLVLISPAGAAHPPASFEGLLDSAVQRIAIGQPDTVPAGTYARQTLRSLKLFDKLTPKLVYGASVRQVLAYVTRDEVDAGIVYTTDARQAGNGVRVIATAAAATHEPIEYPAVIIRASTHQAVARALIEFVLSTPGQRMLAGFGFEPVSAVGR